MTALYIISDRPSAGKTALASALAAQLSRAGKAVGYFKPLSSTPQEDADVEFMGQSILSNGGGDTSQPAPLMMPEGQLLSEDISAELKLSLDALAATNELVLVEGPSLSTSHGDVSPVSTRLAERLDARVLVILQYRPGLDVERVIEMTEPFSQRLLGVLINFVSRYRDMEIRSILVPALESRGVKFLGAIPEDRLMLAATVGQIAQHLDGRWVLGQGQAQGLVENFLIGGNIMDRGDTYFGRMENQAVIVRGDRPDIQLAALSAPATCLVLTGGHEPIQYVYYQAEQQEVPLLVVQADTIATAQSLDSALERSTVHHPRKVERFQELVQQHIDMATVQSV